MCLILIQPKGYVLSQEQLEDFFNHSHDGFGAMWVDKEGVHGVKGVLDLPGVFEAYAQYGAKKACVLHFRMATHGVISQEMAHPMAISKHLMVVHNGVIPGYGNAQESDTYVFTRDVLMPLLGEGEEGALALRDPAMQKHLAGLIGSSNALVFMDFEGVVTKIGRQGLEHDQCWYSNTYAWSPPWAEEDRLFSGSFLAVMSPGDALEYLEDLATNPVYDREFPDAVTALDEHLTGEAGTDEETLMEHLEELMTYGDTEVLLGDQLSSLRLSDRGVTLHPGDPQVKAKFNRLKK